MTDERPDWDQVFLGMAEVFRARADCSRSQVAAIIYANDDHSELGMGYNGLPRGVPGCATAGNCPRGRMSYEELAANTDYSNCAADHAERNAVNDAIRKVGAARLREATIVTTREPCPACSTLLKSVGIARIVYPIVHHRSPAYGGDRPLEVVIC